MTDIASLHCNCITSKSGCFLTIRGAGLRLMYMYIQACMHSTEHKWPLLTNPGDFMTTSDDKSGYWQLDMHPDMWQYLGFEYKGIYYCFKVLPFGISIACWIYSVIKQEVYRPARNQGARLQYLIDDR